MIQKLFLLLNLVIFLVVIPAHSATLIGQVSDYLLSKCSSIGNDAKDAATLSKILLSQTKMCRANETQDPFVQISRDAEDRLFDQLATEQTAMQTCQISNLKNFDGALQKDPELAQYVFAKLQVLLTELQGLEYKKNYCSLASKDSGGSVT